MASAIALGKYANSWAGASAVVASNFQFKDASNKTLMTVELDMSAFGSS
jgi:hypothetical protein